MAMTKKEVPKADSPLAAPPAPPPPPAAGAEPTLAELLDIADIQGMMDDFVAIEDIAMAIVDLQGNLMVAAGFQDICAKFHRVHPDACRHCMESDTILSAGAEPGHFKRYRCQNQLWDMATPITLGDRHVGNLFLGQFFYDDEQPDREAFRAQARQFGFDEAAYLAALDRVPRWNHQKVDRIMTFFARFARQISSVGLRNLQLAQTLAEQKRTEETLQRQKALFSSILESSSEAIFAKDVEGRYLSINTAGANMLGYRPEDVIGRTDMDLLPETTAREFRKTDEQVMSTGQPYARDEAGRIAGKSRIFLAHKTPWRDHAGRIAGVIGVSNDITDRQRASEALQRSEHLLQKIFQTLPIGLWVADQKGRLLQGNPAGLKIWGADPRVPPSEYGPFQARRLPGGEPVAPDGDSLSRALREGVTLADEMLEIDTFDGRKRILLNTTSPVLDDQGRTLGAIIVNQDITDRMRAEAALRESERLYRSILNASPDDITITDLEGRILLVSPSALPMFGCAREDQLVGHLVFEFILPEERERALEDVARLNRGDSSAPIGYRSEYRGRRADGSAFDIEVNGEFIRDASGRPLRMILVVRDISFRKQAEQRLRLQARLLGAVQESVVASDLDGLIQYWGHGAEKLYGYSAEEVLGKPYRDFAGAIDPPDETRFRQEILANGSWHGEHLQRRRNGKLFWTETSISAIVGDEGQPVGFIGIDHDITERRQAEAALRESESRFRNIAELLPDAIFEMDPDGRIVFANKRAFTLLGYTPDDLERGLNAINIVAPEERELARERLLRRLSGKESGAREYSALRKDGSTFPVILNLSPKILGDGPEGFLGAMTDITALKQAEAALQASERRYRTFINATSDLVFLKDDSFRYVISNHANSAFIGKPEEDVIGRTDFDLLPKRAAAHCRDSDLAALQQGAGFISEEAVGDKTYQTIKFPVPLTRGRVGVGGFIRDITKRKQVEEALKASEARHRDIATNIPGVVYQLQINRIGSFDVPYMSAGCEALFEQPLRNLDYSALLFDHMHVGDRALFHHSLAKAAKAMERWNLEFRILPAPDRVKWLRGSANPQRLPNGNVIWNGVLLDITELKLAEQKLKDRDAFQSLLMETIPSPVFYKDRQGRYLGCNQAFETLFGQSKTQIIGKTALDFLPPDLADMIRARDADLLANPGTQVYEATLLDAKGAPHDIVFHKSTIVDAQGSVAGLIGILLDITARKQAERTLLASQERFQQVAESAGEWIWELDADGLYTYSSPVVERILGYTPDELVGKMRFLDLIAPAARERVRKAAAERLARKEGFQRLSNPVVHKDGHEIILETTGRPILAPDGRLLGYRGADTDITARRQAEEQVARQLDELRRWQTVTLGRESRIAELKREVNALASRLGQPPPYGSVTSP